MAALSGSSPANDRMLSRDLDAAAAAFQRGDREMSKRIHSVQTRQNGDRPLGESGHMTGCGLDAWNERLSAFGAGACLDLLAASSLRALANGGLLAAVGISAADSAAKRRLVQTLLVAMGTTAACSISLWHWFGKNAYWQHYGRERDREAWELDNYEEGEKQEMVELFVGRGMGEDDARLVIDTCAKYPNFFVSLMMLEELHMVEPCSSHFGSSRQLGLACGLGALLPALPLLLLPRLSGSTTAMADRAPEVLGMVAITAVGSAKAASKCLPRLQHALEHAAVGLTCLLVPYMLVFGGRRLGGARLFA
eukprot:TRINITY_DN5420_c0_g1_i1.p1 TRINITY_DN5420_c0_g1~~TRINITY_DN5420_c0_g1_i1.p1  ORF type:complete len:308 (+),score=65.98 TRINITY_DN5420_c0_g1_i1:138-1061(+)